MFKKQLSNKNLSFVSEALFNVASAQTLQYNFVDTPLNWTDAQSFCRQFYTDLATIKNEADVSAVVSTTSNYTGKFIRLELCIVIIVLLEKCNLLHTFCCCYALSCFAKFKC